MTDDLISRQAVLDKAYELDLIDTGNDIRVWVVDVDEVKKLPAADFNDYTERLWKEAYERGKRDAQPKKGKWVPYEFGDERWHKCTACGTADKYKTRIERDGEVRYLVAVRNYCPNCGARMEESDGNSD